MPEFDLFLTKENLEELLRKMGYEIDDTGIILDSKGKPVRSIKGEEINIKKDDFAVVSGSIFVKNIAEFSHLLSKRMDFNRSDK